MILDLFIYIIQFYINQNTFLPGFIIRKDKALFEELLDNDNEPLEYKGDVKQGGLLKNKKMIERRVIEKEEDGRLRDYTQYRIQPDVYEVLKPSYDQFYSIIGD